MNGNLMSEGLTLMVLGMGFVFIFLLFLVFATGLLSRIVGRFASFEEAPVEALPSHNLKNGEINPELIAVLAAAVHRHRSAIAK
ncbi:MAG: oxaloacetate decarboxylase gamma chain [Candidatus Celerinatantimonas neptuna]|nr:MAG: oxaloacetate decarboxylase gamma chain [Candidatus Celerinatantimonas neptuna]